MPYSKGALAKALGQFIAGSERAGGQYRGILAHIDRQRRRRQEALQAEEERSRRHRRQDAADRHAEAGETRAVESHRTKQRGDAIKQYRQMYPRARGSKRDGPKSEAVPAGGSQEAPLISLDRLDAMLEQARTPSRRPQGYQRHAQGPSGFTRKAPSAGSARPRAQPPARRYRRRAERPRRPRRARAGVAGSSRRLGENQADLRSLDGSPEVALCPLSRSKDTTSKWPFPDSMSAEEIQAALRDRVMPQLKASRATGGRSPHAAIPATSQAPTIFDAMIARAQVATAPPPVPPGIPATAARAGLERPVAPDEVVSPAPAGPVQEFDSEVTLRNILHSALAGLGKETARREEEGAPNLDLPVDDDLLAQLPSMGMRGANEHQAAVQIYDWLRHHVGRAWDKLAGRHLPQEGPEYQTRTGRLVGEAAEMAGSFMDPEAVTDMAVGSAVGGPAAGAAARVVPGVSRLAGIARRAIQSSGRSAAALGSFERGAVQRAGGDQAEQAEAALSGAKMGAALGLAHLAPGKAAQLLAEYGVFAGMHNIELPDEMPDGEAPDIVDRLVDPLFKLVALKVISPRAAQALTKTRAERTPAERKAVEEIPPAVYGEYLKALRTADRGALRGGRPVSPEVLKDYPNLNKGQFEPDPVEHGSPSRSRGGFLSLGRDSEAAKSRPWLTEERAKADDPELADFFERTGETGALGKRIRRPERPTPARFRPSASSTCPTCRASRRTRSSRSPAMPCGLWSMRFASPKTARSGTSSES